MKALLDPEKFDHFYNDALGKMTFEKAIEEVLAYIALHPQNNYKIFVGSDSLSSGTKASIVSTIVVYRVGNGGRYFWCRFQKNGIHTLRDKIHAEVEASIELAQKVLEALKDKIDDLPQNMEIHADVGQNGNTRELIAEVTGWIRAYGIMAKTKPESFAATSVADRRTIIPS